MLNQVADEQITELMVHPAFVDEHLYFHSSFNIQRTREVALLCDPQMKELFIQNKIETCHYGDIRIPVS